MSQFPGNMENCGRKYSFFQGIDVMTGMNQNCQRGIVKELSKSPVPLFFKSFKNFKILKDLLVPLGFNAMARDHCLVAAEPLEKFDYPLA